MVIISLEHAEPRIEGYLSRHMLKIRPGIFAGRLSKTRRDLLWEHIIQEQPTIDAIMCYDAANYRITLQTYGNPKRHVTDVDGISLLAFPCPEPWKKLLAKPQKLLWEHSVETAIMAETFLEKSNYKSCLDLLYEQTDKSIPVQRFLHSILCIIGLHDLGKLHPFFQENLSSSALPTDMRYGFRHENESGRQLLKFLKKNKGDNSDMRTIRMLTRIVKDHHQGRPESPFETEAKREVDSSEDYNKNISDMIAFICDLYPFTYFSVTGCENLFCQILSGILRFSDWAASSYCDFLTSDSKQYKENCEKMAERFLRDGGLLDTPIPNTRYDYFSLCGLSDDMLHPLQRRLIDVMEEHPKAECLLIEDQPGSGKTEGAFYAAARLLQSYGYSSMYVALPTDATASEMLPRLRKCFQEHGLFADADARLLTGKAWLYNDRKANDVNGAENTDDSSKIEWETHSRKLFAPLACGTVDQLMQAGLNFKAGDLRLLALSRKVVIIDEFHAYDAYMMQIIKVVLMWLRSMRVPVIILSATLLEATRKELFSIYSNEQIESNGYPRITCAENGSVQTYTCAPAKHKEYKCQVISHDETVSCVLKSVQSGGNTLYIANTVKKAWRMFQILQNAVTHDTTVRLYTARTTPDNKDKIGKQLVYLYGKEGKKAGKRPAKTIVVSTQIMEMSLDVDFDTVFSELAPADSLFQRMGRMTRHDDHGTVRETGFQSVFYLVIPNKEKNWHMPYVASVLNGTEEVFKKYPTIAVPEDIPEILEASYERAGEQWIDDANALAAHGTANLATTPNQTYALNTSFLRMSDASTRYQNYPIETILCVPEQEIALDTYEWARNAILMHSVSVPRYLSDGIPSMQDSSQMKWLNHYKIVRNRPDFWGADDQFIFGL